MAETKLNLSLDALPGCVVQVVHQPWLGYLDTTASINMAGPMTTSNGALLFTATITPKAVGNILHCVLQCGLNSPWGAFYGEVGLLFGSETTAFINATTHASTALSRTIVRCEGYKIAGTTSPVTLTARGGTYTGVQGRFNHDYVELGASYGAGSFIRIVEIVA